MSKEELAVQVGQIYRIEVHDVNLAKASGDEILQELASYSTSADHKDARLQRN